MVTEIEHPDCGPVKLVSPPVKYSSPPPTLGQHTDEILEGVLGMSREEIDSLKSEGVVA
jgi:succinate--hydroxymethylglutarate CoA-transferase